jgi:hypothetical protein
MSVAPSLSRGIRGEIMPLFTPILIFIDPQRLQINFLRLFPLQPRLAFSGNLPMKTLVSMEYRMVAFARQ